jgi:hypothetical protein
MDNGNGLQEYLRSIFSSTEDRLEEKLFPLLDTDRIIKHFLKYFNNYFVPESKIVISSEENKKALAKQFLDKLKKNILSDFNYTYNNDVTDGIEPFDKIREYAAVIGEEITPGIEEKFYQLQGELSVSFETRVSVFNRLLFTPIDAYMSPDQDISFIIVLDSLLSEVTSDYFNFIPGLKFKTSYNKGDVVEIKNPEYIKAIELRLEKGISLRQACYHIFNHHKKAGSKESRGADSEDLEGKFELFYQSLKAFIKFHFIKKDIPLIMRYCSAYPLKLKK